MSSKALRMHDAWFPDYDRDYDDDVGDDEYSAGGGGGGGEYGVPHGTPAAAAAPAVNAGGEYAFSADPSSSWQHTMSDASYKFDFSRDT
ncbi:hypothetical protein EON67_01705 [archaeon]|nr:MAG: hypothetical protein EON67_01705 [archaeon]